jgi:hypothetical protein
MPSVAGWMQKRRLSPGDSNNLLVSSSHIIVQYNDQLEFQTNQKAQGPV